MRPADFALFYVAIGWPVLPLWWPVGAGLSVTLPPDREPGDDGDEVYTAGVCACPRGAACTSPAKHPIAALAPRGSHDATTDEATVRAWWERFPDANVGITLPGLVALDVDPRLISLPTP